MSVKIKELAEVIEQVRAKFLQDETQSIRELRIEAIASTAARRGIRKQTVTDKIRRKLRPDINWAYEFDELLDGWLRNGVIKLRTILFKHAASSRDEEIIDDIFRERSKPPGV